VTAILADPKLLWYLARSTGAVCLVLLTVTTVLGLTAARRVGSTRWPRFLTQGLHRLTALLALVLLVGHVAVVVADDYVTIRPIEAVVPFIGTYHPLWLGLGALAADVMLVVGATSLVGRRLSHRVWRAVHWSAYASWPLAVAHGLGTGTDPAQAWFAVLTVLCTAAVGSALLSRLREGNRGWLRAQVGGAA
jgi:methionine sulfoxide reductase heme-binding subunit